MNFPMGNKLKMFGIDALLLPTFQFLQNNYNSVKNDSQQTKVKDTFWSELQTL